MNQTMEIFEFDKSLQERLGESMNVLSWKDTVIPASQVRTEWAYYIELQIEPAGWQTLWKIPRVICEELGVRYPTVVFGVVEQVLFKELKATFLVLAVQDNDVHLPERHEVALEDLWPTRDQENDALNIDRTAECVDQLRFFYTNVWMPWDKDYDDDLNWVDKHLESRIRFCYDIRKKSIKRALAAHIRTLLLEAKYLQQRRDYLEMDLSDDDDDELNATLDKSQITDLMRLHLRLAMIRSEMEMLENPELRRIYEEIHFDNDKHLKICDRVRKDVDEHSEERIGYVVALPATVERQLELLRLVQQHVPDKSRVHMCPSLQDVLSICNASDSIFLAPGRHSMKFLEYLNDSGSIVGLSAGKTVAEYAALDDTQAVLMSPDDNSMLIVFDGDFTLEQLVLDCINIRTGILVKHGHVRLRNCRLIGDGKSSTQQGIVCSRGAEVTLDNCSVENFGTGIVLNQGSSMSLIYSRVLACGIGLELNKTESDQTKIIADSSCISDAKRCGVYVDALALKDTNAKTLAFNQLSDLMQQLTAQTQPWEDEISFANCKQNICVVNRSKRILADQTVNCMRNENNEYDVEICDEPPTQEAVDAPTECDGVA